MDPRSQLPSWSTNQFINTIFSLNKLKFMQWFGRKRRLNFWINWLGNGVEESKKEPINNALHPVIQQTSKMSLGARIWLMINWEGRQVSSIVSKTTSISWIRRLSITWKARSHFGTMLVWKRLLESYRYRVIIPNLRRNSHATSVSGTMKETAWSSGTVVWMNGLTKYAH